MSNMEESDKEFEAFRWRIFNKLCKIACDIPNKLIDIIVPPVKIKVKVAGEGKDMEECNMLSLKLKER